MQSSLGEVSEASFKVKKMSSEEGFASETGTERRILSNNGLFIINNPV
jgi:hypothetical protein